MELGPGRFDYCSFLIECPADLFQDIYLAEWKRAIVDHMTLTEQKKNQRVHALGATKSGNRRYVLALWGEPARLVTNLPFPKWGDDLTRVDIRRTVYGCADDTYEKLCVALEYAETKNNIESFKVKRRTKNHQRDTGGRGVRYGSRKSDRSSKIYKRGNEKPAIETQFQDDVLDAMVLKALEQSIETRHILGGWEELRTTLEAAQDRHFSTWLFQASIEAELDGLRDHEIPVPTQLLKTYQLELFGGPIPEPASEGTGADDHNGEYFLGQ